MTANNAINGRFMASSPYIDEMSRIAPLRGAIDLQGGHSPRLRNFRAEAVNVKNRLGGTQSWKHSIFPLSSIQRLAGELPTLANKKGRPRSFVKLKVHNLPSHICNLSRQKTAGHTKRAIIDGPRKKHVASRATCFRRRTGDAGFL